MDKVFYLTTLLPGLLYAWLTTLAQLSHLEARTILQEILPSKALPA